MGLNKINLSPYLTTQLYAATLVAEPLTIAPALEQKKDISGYQHDPENAEWKFLGNNKKQVLIGVDYKEITHLPDVQLDFLTQLLKACRLSLNDVTIINLNNFRDYDYTDILNHFKSAVILLFGISARQFGFPFETPHYQVQKFTIYTVLHAPALHDLQNDKPAKGKLWEGLKKTFNI